MKKLTTEKLFEINGGDKSDRDFGYEVGRGLKKVWNAVKGVWESIWD